MPRNSWRCLAGFAVIEHMPVATIVTVVPETVQTGVVVEAKPTGNPELAEH